MRTRVLAVALAGLALPALALAAQPVFIRVDGHTVPMREVVQVVNTTAGPVRVRTWSWRGPNGAAAFQVSESRGAGAALPSWALAQMRAMQAQMRQMRLIEAALAQPLLTPALPVPAVFGQPLLLPLGAPPVEVRYLPPMFPLRAVPLPVRVILFVPKAPTPHVAPPPPRHRGRLV
jgi:hypothetical protein